MTINNKIISLEKAIELSQEWKAAGEKVVFTNGCFDLLHAGHITYLSEAAALGTKLIIGLNADKSVQVLKGPSRPINDEKTRSLLLAAMQFIDAVVIFEEQTPQNLIRQILPDVLVKGGDYTLDNIVGAKEVLENGGEVQTLSFLPGYSSTSIIDKIKNS
ncbi:D-glycero-beta-D-manno-heptose 1-phosphate adenylyltransferase [Pedobacter puniceum]|jgi:rfaE bifunctional protein nucleotidyltransferase chain/domain|uniref:D-glycero-beta-D-manno-heptose 1-phosphate adenylyltransferase n=1 Tax=Pedobacter puniceum TaxID=2666136 RepID=A0A7K0FJA2_9SPHI|nr:D-glycero-beta-D-manno-heptose 1-phosphate adenylyltransferase [Pedobacter puniceum]MRX46003.1 D-glycero-beta-D-manno-heptose 1-phosphate adenylyltransferase [Pedobacter puniceum]